MIIAHVPSAFQPEYRTMYPRYSAGKHIEEKMYAFFLKEQEHIHTEYVYLPIFWTSLYIRRNYGKQIDDVYNWLEQLDSSKKYFTVIQYADGIYIRKPLPAHIKVFAAGGKGLNVKDTPFDVSMRPHYDLPLLYDFSFPRWNIPKDIYCSFIGSCSTHPIRKKCQDQLSHLNGLVFADTIQHSEYIRTMNRSVFSLCPRGFGLTSFRLFEAIAAHAIPVYIWSEDAVLPYKDKIDWESFCVLVHEDDIGEIPHILSQVDIPKYTTALQKVTPLFTYEYMFEYIKEKIGKN